MKFLTGVAACLLLVTNAHAATVVIDFEDVAVGTVDPISSHGFGFSGLTTAKVVQRQNYLTGNSLEVDSITGSAGLTWSLLNFSQQGLVPFDLKSFGMKYELDYDVDINVTGQYANGGSIQQTFRRYLYNGMQVTLGTDWTNLKSARIEILQYTYSAPRPIYLDNITVSTVPVPAAVWFFASGLGLLGWLRHQRAANQ